MPHSLSQDPVVFHINRQPIDGLRMPAYLTTQTVCIQDYDKCQGDSYSEAWVPYPFLKGDERRHAADNCTVVTRQSTISNQSERQLPSLDTIDDEL